MKLKIEIFYLIMFMTNLVFGQNTIKMTSNYGSENNEIQDLIDFENIFIQSLNFQGDKLKGNFYIINLEEFKNGKLIKTSTLFDGSETDYFKIETDNESLKFFFKLSHGKLKTYVRGKKFGSKKSYFKLNTEADKYALKDFFGSNEEMNIELNKKTAVFAIITPTLHKDGSGSYCEVAQSSIKPEKLGEHFKIPHYFLITITLK